MLTRRRLLAGAGVTLVSGCSLDPTVVWLPWTPPSPFPIADATAAAQRCAALSARATSLVAQAKPWKIRSATVAGLTWLAGSGLDHARVLASTDPGRRQLGVAPTVAPPTEATAAAAWAALDRELASAVTDWRARAGVADGVVALLWASLATWGAALRPVIGSGRFVGGADTATTAPAPATTDWRVTMIKRSREAVYGFESALAARRLSSAERRLLWAETQRWAALRDQLSEAQRAVSAEIPAPVPAYRLPVPADRTAAWALARRLTEQALPQLGAWVAGTTVAEDRVLAVTELIATGRAAIRFGAPAAKWPGWAG